MSREYFIGTTNATERTLTSWNRDSGPGEAGRKGGVEGDLTEVIVPCPQSTHSLDFHSRCVKRFLVVYLLFLWVCLCLRLHLNIPINMVAQVNELTITNLYLLLLFVLTNIFIFKAGVSCCLLSIQYKGEWPKMLSYLLY